MFGTASSSIRRQKMFELNLICKSNSVIGVFESHGNPVALVNEIRKYIKSHVVLSFPCKEKGVILPNTGGVVILIHKKLASASPDDPSYCEKSLCREIVPGRVVRVTLGQPRLQSFACVFVHNYGLTARHMSSVESMASKDMLDAAEHPHMFAATYMGDFNLQPHGELPHPLSSPTPVNRNVAPDAIVSTRPFQARWEKIFEGMIEVRFSQNTHFNSSNNFENRIDRVFEVMPKSNSGLTQALCWHL